MQGLGGKCIFLTQPCEIKPLNTTLSEKTGISSHCLQRNSVSLAKTGLFSIIRRTLRREGSSGRNEIESIQNMAQNLAGELLKVEEEKDLWF
jgi:hypothetical protein